MSMSTLVVACRYLGEEFEFSPTHGPVVIGRDPNAAIRLEHGVVSRVHAVFTNEAGDWVVTDWSTNGTRVNGTKLPKGVAYPVYVGDVVNVLGVEFIVGGFDDN